MDIEPGRYRVTTYEGETRDYDVIGVDHRNEADYLVYQSAAAGVDPRVSVGHTRLLTDPSGAVWRFPDGRLESREPVPADEVACIAAEHAAGLPTAAPPAPPEPQIRPQTADSDAVGPLTGADTPPLDPEAQNGESAENAFTETPPAEDAPKADGPAVEDAPAGPGDSVTATETLAVTEDAPPDA